MVTREQLTILEHAVQQAHINGFLQEEATTPLIIDLLFDPPSLCVHRSPDSTGTDRDWYLDPLFPLLERDFAVAYWGRGMMPSQAYIVMPAWKYHQHRLLEFLQDGDMDGYFQYIAFFL